MIIAEQCFYDCINSPVRHVRARVELYNGSTLLDTFRHTDRLISLTIERVAEGGKFFGFGICQKLNIKLIDKERELNITTANTLDIAFGTGCDFIYTSPYYKVTEVHRDETTNALSITAYDALYTATALSVSQLDLPAAYTIEEFANACGALLGLPVNIQQGITAFSTLYSSGANFEGTESIRAALDAIAEATQTIYYIDNEWRLTFKRLDKSGAAVAAINKNNYFALDSGENRRLSAVCSATELGDNYISSLDKSGTTQYIRNNPFLELREDVAVLVDNALAAVGGLTINQFDCEWRGNYLVEIGDKISLEAKDGSTVYSYLLDDTITYDGVLSQITRWQYSNNENESVDNPTNIGDALRQTYAKVDKVNKDIAIVAGNVETNSQQIAAIKLDTQNISLTVENVKKETSTYTQDISDIKRTTTTLATDIADLEQAAATAADDIAGLETATANNAAAIGTITTTVETHTQELTAIKQTNSDISLSVSNISTTVETHTNDIAGVIATAATNKSDIAALKLDKDSITATVSNLTETTTNALANVEGDITTLSKQVQASMTAEAVKLSIQEELANGVDKVYTSTGFSFDADGLKINKTGSEMETLLDEDGLTVYRDNVEVLTADNTGVNGINMTVRQYLIVGGSRFEAYGEDRTGCFWVG